MRYRLLLLISLLSFLFFAPAPAGAASGSPGSEAAVSPEQREELLRRQAQNLDLSELDGYVDRLNQTWAGYGPEISLTDFLEVYKGGEDAKYAPMAILSGLARYLVREVAANTGLLAELIVLAVLAALLQNMQSAFESDTTGKLAHAVVYLVLVGLAITGFGLAVSQAREVMSSLSNFMLAMLPTLLTLLIGMGGVASAAIFHPLMITFTSAVATIVVTVVFPLIFLAAILDIVSGLNDQFQLTNLAGLFRQGASYVMGISFTLFLGVVAVKGAAGAVADGVTMKTAKFMISNFIPVVGKMFSDATDLIFGSSILLKNALGIAGLAVVFFIAAFPLLKILALVVVYQLAGALVQPVGAKQIAKMLTTMAKSLQLIFASVAVVTLMFFISITVIVGAGNLTVMVR